MAAFVKVTTLDQLQDGIGTEVECQGRIIALFRCGDRVFALDGICPHQGGPLAEGELKGEVVTCPWHGWMFNLSNGQSVLHSRVRQPVYDVQVQGQDVLVALS